MLKRKIARELVNIFECLLPFTGLVGFFFFSLHHKSSQLTKYAFLTNYILFFGTHIFKPSISLKEACLQQRLSRTGLQRRQL